MQNEMLTKEQEERIKNLYKEYQYGLKQSIFYVERGYHSIPKGLLNEFRDVFDHISRCYENDATEQYINDNIEKAESHFDRIKLDIYKFMSDYKKSQFSKWKRKYNKYDLQNIDNGDFWKTVLTLEQEAEVIFTEARKIESKDVSKSCELLCDSTAKYDEIEERIEEKRDRIVKAVFKYRRVTIVNWMVGFGIGIFASIIANIIWSQIAK